MNLKGHNNGRQIVAALLTGLVVGLGATLQHLASHPELYKDSLSQISPVLLAVVSAGLVNLVNWYRGRDPKEIVDSILGNEDEPNG